MIGVSKCINYYKSKGLDLFIREFIFTIGWLLYEFLKRTK